MFVWLGIAVFVVLMWMGVIEAFDMLERRDRERDNARAPKITDRLVKYQERDY